MQCSQLFNISFNDLALEQLEIDLHFVLKVTPPLLVHAHPHYEARHRVQLASECLRLPRDSILDPSR